MSFHIIKSLSDMVLQIGNLIWTCPKRVKNRFGHVRQLTRHYCLVLLKVTKCFGLVQIFCARPKINLHIVPVPNFLCKTKRWFPFDKFSYCASTKPFEAALNAIHFLVWHKKIGLEQNILWHIKGQGLCIYLRDHPFKTLVNFHDF